MDDLKIITIIVNLYNKQQIWNLKYQLLIHDQNFFNQALLFVITLNKDDDSNVESCCVTSDARHPRVCLREKKTHDWKWPVCLLLSLLAWFWPFRPGYGLSGLCLAFLTLYITWLFAKKMSFVFSRRTVNMVYKRVCRNCPISSCGAKYLARLANHLADVHQVDHIQRRQYLQEAKLQP